MNAPTLYSSLLSANGRKTQAICIELSIDILIKEINVYTGDGNKPEYLSINSLGQIPTLCHNDLILTESNAILIYLANEFNGSVLLGNTHREKAKLLQWLFWESSQWQPMLNIILAASVGHKLAPNSIPKPTQPLNWQSKHCADQLKLLDNNLVDNKWILGSTFSLADFSIAAMTTYFQISCFPFETYKNIARWLDDLEKRPAWKNTQHDLWQ